MPSEWTKHNIRLVEGQLDTCPQDLRHLVDEILARAREPESEEKAVVFYELQQKLKEYRCGKTTPSIWASVCEVVAVCLYKDLRQTRTVQEEMHDPFIKL